MTIEKTINGNELTLRITGRLDTITSPKLEAELSSSLAGIAKLTLDFAELEYLSSAGLRVLLAAQKTMNKQGEMTVINVGEAVQEVFDITGFSSILNIV